MRARTSFGGAQTLQFAHTDLNRIIYRVKSDREDLVQDLGSSIEEVFGTTDQVGTAFEGTSRDGDELVFITKRAIRNGHIYAITFLDGEIYKVSDKGEVKQSGSVSGTSSQGELKNSIQRALFTGKVK